MSISCYRHVLGEELLYPPDVGPSDKKTAKGIGLAEAALSCAMSNSELTQRQMLLDNILLCGGGAQVPNVHPRFISELRGLLPSAANIAKLTYALNSLCHVIRLAQNICSRSNFVYRIPEYMPARTNQYASYVGGAIVAKSLNANHTMSKEDYEDRGPAYIHKKC
jgi:actin-related protein